MDDHFRQDKDRILRACQSVPSPDPAVMMGSAVWARKNSATTFFFFFLLRLFILSWVFFPPPSVGGAVALISPRIPNNCILTVPRPRDYR